MLAYLLASCPCAAVFAGAMLLEYALSGESPLAHFGFIAPGVPLAMVRFTVSS